MRKQTARLRALRGTVESTSQHSNTWWLDKKLVGGKRRGLEVCAEPSVPPVNTVLHGQSDGILVRKEAGLGALRGTLYSTSQNSTVWTVRWNACEEMGGGGERVGAGGRSLELCLEPSVPPVNTVPHGGQKACEERGRT